MSKRLIAGSAVVASLVLALGAGTTAWAHGQPETARGPGTSHIAVNIPHVNLGDAGMRPATSRLKMLSGHRAVHAFGGDLRRMNTGTVRTVCQHGGDYQTIQGAVNASSDGDTIVICPGGFVENVDVTKGVTIRGAGQDDTIVEPAVSDPNCGGAGGGTLCTPDSAVFLVQANNVTISRLTVDGNNPNISSGVTVGGSDIDARNGIVTDFTSGNYSALDVNHVTVENVFHRGIYATGLSASVSFTFTHDTVNNVQGDYSSIAMFSFAASGTFADNRVSNAGDAISSNHSNGIQFLDNTVTNSGSGLHTDNSGEFGSTDVIAGNSVRDCNSAQGGYGIFVFAAYSPVYVAGNRIRNCSVGLSSYGTGEGAVPTPTITFAYNVVDGEGLQDSIGALVTTDLLGYGCSPTSNVFIGNVITGNTNSFYTDETNIFSAFGYSDCALAGGLSLSAHANVVTDNDVPGSSSGPFLTGNTGTGWYNDAAGPLDATYNWWGCKTGPNTGRCDSVAPRVNYTPWLTHRG